MPVRAPGRVSAEDNGRPKAEGKSSFSTTFYRIFLISPNKRIHHLQAFLFQYQKTNLPPGERNEHPFRDVFFELIGPRTTSCFLHCSCLFRVVGSHMRSWYCTLLPTAYAGALTVGFRNFQNESFGRPRKVELFYDGKTFNSEKY